MPLTFRSQRAPSTHRVAARSWDRRVALPSSPRAILLTTMTQAILSRQRECNMV